MWVRRSLNTGLDHGPLPVRAVHADQARGPIRTNCLGRPQSIGAEGLPLDGLTRDPQELAVYQCGCSGGGKLGLALVLFDDNREAHNLSACLVGRGTRALEGQRSTGNDDWELISQGRKNHGDFGRDHVVHALGQLNFLKKLAGSATEGRRRQTLGGGFKARLFEDQALTTTEGRSRRREGTTGKFGEATKGGLEEVTTGAQRREVVGMEPRRVFQPRAKNFEKRPIMV
ncbi:hypothetical protein N7532_007936 [Penicillium argentinense]|uniref:Uncharacterized protein n=1 Tax=Penicillium argentinense TaxID=1131581 RepID=A0A9W9K213_9EURO|nr:uncharacterized protein N7532_007936 [Penicillium argentinense]KAJ5089252.1 hypothetical protein N7532_007936 [Penicillium argentinense]